MDDEVLIDKMRQKKFANRATFSDLFDNNEVVLAVNYPPLNPNDPYDRSSADMALASTLAFWTGQHCSGISGLTIRTISL